MASEKEIKLSNDAKAIIDNPLYQKAYTDLRKELVDELLAADTIVISTPIYNFGPPAAAKAWFDMVARAGRTFAYEPTGPKGLIEGNKKVYLIVSSGGVPIDSPVDFCTPWFKQALNFLGITDIKVIDASQLNKSDENLKNAQQEVNSL